MEFEILDSIEVNSIYELKSNPKDQLKEEIRYVHTNDDVDIINLYIYIM